MKGLDGSSALPREHGDVVPRPVNGLGISGQAGQGDSTLEMLRGPLLVVRIESGPGCGARRVRGRGIEQGAYAGRGAAAVEHGQGMVHPAQELGFDTAGAAELVLFLIQGVQGLVDAPDVAEADAVPRCGQDDACGHHRGPGGEGSSLHGILRCRSDGSRGGALPGDEAELFGRAAEFCLQSLPLTAVRPTGSSGQVVPDMPVLNGSGPAGQPLDVLIEPGCEFVLHQTRGIHTIGQYGVAGLSRHELTVATTGTVSGAIGGQKFPVVRKRTTLRIAFCGGSYGDLLGAPFLGDLKAIGCAPGRR